MIIHYNCTIGSILLHSFLLIYHPYPPSFHEMIFILVECVSHFFTRGGHVKVVRYLVDEAHCDPHVMDNFGWTPLHIACK